MAKKQDLKKDEKIVQTTKAIFNQGQNVIHCGTIEDPKKLRPMGTITLDIEEANKLIGMYPTVIEALVDTKARDMIEKDLKEKYEKVSAENTKLKAEIAKLRKIVDDQMGIDDQGDASIDPENPIKDDEANGQKTEVK